MCGFILKLVLFYFRPNQSAMYSLLEWNEEPIMPKNTYLVSDLPHSSQCCSARFCQTWSYVICLIQDKNLRFSLLSKFLEMDTNAFLQNSKFNAPLENPYQKRSSQSLKGLQLELQFKIWWNDVHKCNYQSKTLLYKSLSRE